MCQSSATEPHVAPYSAGWGAGKFRTKWRKMFHKAENYWSSVMVLGGQSLVRASFDLGEASRRPKRIKWRRWSMLLVKLVFFIVSATPASYSNDISCRTCSICSSGVRQIWRYCQSWQRKISNCPPSKKGTSQWSTLGAFSNCRRIRVKWKMPVMRLKCSFVSIFPVNLHLPITAVSVQVEK